MLKKIAFAGVGIVLLASPLIASADTISDIQAKVRELVAQVLQLKAQLASQSTTPATGTSVEIGIPVAIGRIDPSSICPRINRALTYGISGDDVTQLQRFLVAQGLLSDDSATGFFGPRTKAAVQNLQAQNGIVASGDTATTGWGAVGPATRAWIAQWCNGNNPNFSASPTSGPAPLTVQFSARIQATEYSLDFGDGSPVVAASRGQVQCTRAGNDALECPQPTSWNISQSHTYTANGTYTAKLTYQPPMRACPAGMYCAQAMPAQQTRTVVITVGSQTSNTMFSASPTSGAAPLAVVFRTNVMNGLESYSISFADGTSGTFQNNCQSGYGACGLPTANHTYTANGTYTATLSRHIGGPSGPDQQIGTVTITVTGSPTTSGAPVISSVDGPVSIAVGSTGMWTVRASVPNNTNTQLRYAVIWGDEAVLDQIRAFGSATAGALQTSGTFTHAYGRAGTFRPTFTVSNTAGSAQTSVSVAVGGGTEVCTASYRYCPAGTHNGGRCDQDCIPDNTSSTFSATPTSGNAPLTVAFRTPAGDEESFSVAFGDGVSGAMGIIEGGVARGVSHTYTANGTYTATLTKFTAGACSAGYCATNQVAGTVTIQVGGGSTSSGTFTATPKTGTAPLMVTFTGVGNNISFGDDGPTLIATGSGSLGTLTHVYRNFGEYTATSVGRSVNISVTTDKLAAFGSRSLYSNSCVYNNRTYQSGTSADVPTKTCSRGASFSGVLCDKLAIAGSPTSISSQRYTCNNGQWLDSNNSPLDGELVNATSCLASDGVTAVGNGQLIVQGVGAIASFDQYAAFGKRIPTMKCSNGAWLNCDANGNNCTQAAASDGNANLANALTAVESALKAIISLLGR